MAGGSLVGLIGGILAILAAAILQVVLSTYFTRHEVIDSDLTGSAPEPVDAARR